MSTRASFFHAGFVPAAAQVADKAEPPTGAILGRTALDAGRFADEQIRRLVRQVFFPGWPKPAHHVAFAAVDERTDAGVICIKVGEILSSQAPGNTCIVESTAQGDTAELGLSDTTMRSPGQDAFDATGSRTHRLSSRLWQMPYEVFSENCEGQLARSALEVQVGRLRAQYDYSVIQLPPVGGYNDAVLLGQLSDGVVLIVEANSTRRAAAQRVKEMLLAANVRLLGTVLNGRTFPIPRAIYQKI